MFRFLAWIRIALFFEGAERSDDAGARVGGLDDRVDVAALGATKGLAKRSRIQRFFLTGAFRARFGTLSSSRLLTMFYGAFGTHDRDSAVGQAKLASVRMCFEAMTQYAPP